jgi:hypothetical protein
MPKIDAYEEETLSAYEEGKLKSVANKEELAKFKEAARATAIKGKPGR